jgi:hypothetical protein
MGIDFIPDHWLPLMSKRDRDAYAEGRLTAAEATHSYLKKREIQEQKIFNSWLNRQLAERKLYTINPRSDKASTIRRGHPDYTIFLPNARVLLLEMKVQDGILSADQIQCIGLLAELGYEVEIPHSAAQAINIVRKFL